MRRVSEESAARLTSALPCHMQKLTLTYAETLAARSGGKEVLIIARRVYRRAAGRVRKYASVSRATKWGRPRAINECKRRWRKTTGYKLGQRVRHAKFGEELLSTWRQREHSWLCSALSGASDQMAGCWARSWNGFDRTLILPDDALIRAYAG